MGAAMAKFEAASLDKQWPGLHQAAGNAPASREIEGLYRGAGHAHDMGAFFLGHAFVIHQPEAFVFLEGDADRGIISCPVGNETRNSGQGVYALYFRGPAHDNLLFDICHNLL